MLAQIGNEDCFEHLTRMLKNAKHDVRAIVASTLGEKKDTRAVEPLISALQDEDPLVIENAADALKNITNQDLGEDHNQWLEWWQSPHEDYNQWLEWWQRQSSQNEK
jgi:HEAT repeat protein